MLAKRDPGKGFHNLLNILFYADKFHLQKYGVVRLQSIELPRNSVFEIYLADYLQSARSLMEIL